MREASAHGRPVALLAAALAVARAEVRRALRRARRARARERGWGPGDDSRFTLVRPFVPRRSTARVLRALPFRVARELRSRSGPTPCSHRVRRRRRSASSAAKLARVPTRVIADIHGDPAAPARLYGSASQGARAPSRRSCALRAAPKRRRADDLGVHVEPRASRRGSSPPPSSPRSWISSRSSRPPPAPLPEKPVALFVGVLERYKAVDVLAEAWRRAAPNVPDATLHLVGRGALREIPKRSSDELPAQTRWTEALTTPEVARALDESTVLVLPSRSEGLGRVVVEAFCRGRGVVGEPRRRDPRYRRGRRHRRSRAARDADGLADALVRTLSDRSSRSVSEPPAAAVQPWLATPEEYARRSASSSTRSRARLPRLTRCARTGPCRS